MQPEDSGDTESAGDLRAPCRRPLSGYREPSPWAVAQDGDSLSALNVCQMDEDRFNISIRKFLKEVGVTSQRAIEKAVRDALEARTLSAGEAVDATMTLEIAALSVKHVITHRIETA